MPPTQPLAFRTSKDFNCLVKTIQTVQWVQETPFTHPIFFEKGSNINCVIKYAKMMVRYAGGTFFQKIINKILIEKL